MVVVDVQPSTLDYASHWCAAAGSGLGARRSCCWADGNDAFVSCITPWRHLLMHPSSLDVDLVGEIYVHIGRVTMTFLLHVLFRRHCLYSFTCGSHFGGFLLTSKFLSKLGCEGLLSHKIKF